MRKKSVPNFALSEAAEETIKSTVLVALFLGVVGTSVDSNGDFRWKSLLPGSGKATAAVVEAEVPPAPAASPTIATAARVTEDAQTGAVPESAPATRPDGVALASDICQDDTRPLGLCAIGTVALVQSSFPGASSDRSSATVN